jgi:hypothetical protein
MPLPGYARRGVDEQAPHTRHELCLVARGSDTFVSRATALPVRDRRSVVRYTRVPHRFEDCTDYFGILVAVHGPERVRGRAEHEVERNETIEVQPIAMVHNEITGDVKQRAEKWLEAIS